MKILIKPKDSGNVIATIAIGKKCFQDWKTYAFPSWRLYCKKNKLGLICFDEDLIDKNHKKWKKATWQKLLIATTLKNSNYSIIKKIHILFRRFKQAKISIYSNTIYGYNWR